MNRETLLAAGFENVVRKENALRESDGMLCLLEILFHGPPAERLTLLGHDGDDGNGEEQ